MQGWRIVRNTTLQRGDHVKFYNTEFQEGSLFRCALGSEVRVNGEGFVWDKMDRCWWISISNTLHYIACPDEQLLSEEDITDELLEEVVRKCNLDHF